MKSMFCRLEKILDSIQDDALRNKFHQAYESTRSTYEKAMNC